VESEKQTARPRGTDSARIIQIIETKALSGSGTVDDRVQLVTQYWTLDGELIATF
jgi:hypothetical protein